MTCRHLVDKRCKLNLFGGTPRPEDCGICPAYDGEIRGAGDVIACGLSRLGADRLAPKSCRCGERRARLNQILPTRKP